MELTELKTELETPMLLQIFAGAKVGGDASVKYQDTEKQTEALNTFLSRDMKDALYEDFTLKSYCDEITIPKNSGHQMKMTKYSKYDANITEYAEGVVITPDSPMYRYEYAVNLADYAGYTTYTDLVDIYDIDNGVAARYERNQMASLAEKMNYKMYCNYLSSLNHWFAYSSTLDTSSLTTARSTLGTINLKDFINMRAVLRRQHVKPYDGQYYYVLISPEVATELMTIKKTAEGDEYSFLEINKMQNVDKLVDGELGTFMGFKFIIDDGIVNIPGTNDYTYGCIVLGKYRNEKGAKRVKLEGEGEIIPIVKSTSEGGAIENPLNSIGSIGWKIYGMGFAIKYQEAVCIYECKSALKIAAEISETQRADYLRSSRTYDDATKDVATSGAIINGGVVENVFIVQLASSNGTRKLGTLSTVVAAKGATTSTIATALLTSANKDTSATVYTDVACTTAVADSDTITSNTVLYFKVATE